MNENDYPTGQLKTLPNSTGVLVMGILSILCICCTPMAFIGLVLAILAIVMGRNAEIEYKNNIGIYAEVSYKNARAGKICGIVSLSLFVMFILLIVVFFGFVSFAIIGELVKEILA